MKSVAVCLFSLLISVSAASAEAPTVSGHVRLVDGSAVAGAQVLLFDVSDLRRGAVGRATTDADGQFALSLGASGLPTRFALGQNYPNPFNPGTVIPYQLEIDGYVRLEVFNLLGQRVATLVDGLQSAGSYTARWDARDASGYGVAAGVYVYRLTVGEAMATRRMVLVDGVAGEALGATPVVPDAAVDAGTYGLVVSGMGIEPYVDTDFRVEQEMGPVVIEVAALGRAKGMQGDDSRVLGDVDNDGQVNLSDALLVAMYLLSPGFGLPNGGDIALGDVNGDRVINITDVWLIATYTSDPSAAGLPAGIGEPVAAGALVGGFDAPVKLTDEGLNTSPAWSPDGRKIAFVSGRDGGILNIYVMDADGRNLTRLTDEGSNQSPSWSPDGTRLVFTTGSADGEGQAIYVMDADGGNWTRLTFRGAYSSPVWSPDGRKIAFVSAPSPNANHEIYVMDADGSNPTRLTDAGWNGSPVWSPDGHKIAFQSNLGTGETTGFDIYVMNADGSELTRLTDTGNNSSPSWSPDGTQIAFVSEDEIYVMDADGGNRTRLTAQDVGTNLDPSWSPDGTRIAFVASRDGVWGVYVAAVASEVEVEVIANDGRDEVSLGGTGGETRTFSLPGGGEMEFVWIEPGVFQMGSPDSEEGRDSDEKVHEVEISTGFWLGKYEVTQGQWEAVMRETPWFGGAYVQSNSSHPAVYISWEDVRRFATKLNNEAGEAVYRLPTEAEWEYACRAGTQTRWSFGDDEFALGNYAWYRYNARNAGEQYAHAVGTKLPNDWGLYDMHGNVWEWVNDWYGANYYNSSPSVDPPGPSTGSFRVIRGGDFYYAAQSLRSAQRTSRSPDFGNHAIGVRLLRIR